MPELPEVEVVRRGLQRWVCGRTIAGVEVLHPRAVRRHAAGPADFAARLAGARIGPARRRGKYLWLPLDGGPGAAGTGGCAIVAHLGMSGQLLVRRPEVPDETHLRVRFRFADGGTELRFVDQRTFGSLSVHEAISGDPDGTPEIVSHIARDPIDPAFDEDAFHAALRRRHTGLKRALLDQSLISGVGNIYADEALWRARLHYERSTATMTRPRTAELISAVRDVLNSALAGGGTSFDRLYVDVNGNGGQFAPSLDVYGREDLPCHRCGTPIRRVAFMNRSSHFCPRCQRAPRPARAGGHSDEGRYGGRQDTFRP